MAEQVSVSRPVCPIAEIEVISVTVPNAGRGGLDGLVETTVVKIHDEAGRYGFGETDAPPALDIALHDLAGKQLGIPAYKLMGGARRPHLQPYCTIYPGLSHGRGVAGLMEEIGRQFDAALAVGFRAVKMEVLFYDLVSDAGLVACIKEGRRMLGDGIVMALDFGYRWKSWHDALLVLQRIADCNIYFAEATLQHDDLDGRALFRIRLAPRVRQSSAPRSHVAGAGGERWNDRATRRPRSRH
jgi:L-rhamnonate dehydratase